MVFIIPKTKKWIDWFDINHQIRFGVKSRRYMFFNIYHRFIKCIRITWFDHVWCCYHRCSYNRNCRPGNLIAVGVVILRYMLIIECLIQYFTRILQICLNFIYMTLLLRNKWYNLLISRLPSNQYAWWWIKFLSVHNDNMILSFLRITSRWHA